MRANRNPELRSEQQDRERLVESAQAAIVELAEVDRTGLHQLLEHHAIRRMLTRRNSDRARRIVAWPRISSGLVGSSIHSGLNRASGRMNSIASPTSHAWFASIIIVASGPISSRTS